jgi:hypothetical protein
MVTPNARGGKVAERAQKARTEGGEREARCPWDFRKEKRPEESHEHSRKSPAEKGAGWGRPLRICSGVKRRVGMRS